MASMRDAYMTSAVSHSQDLTKPEEARFRSQLSSLVNFIRFRETKISLYLEWQAENEALLQDQASLAATNEELVGAYGSVWHLPCWS